jgi:DNA-binding MarR family transcriptional regulator
LWYLYHHNSLVDLKSLREDLFSKEYHYTINLYLSYLEAEDLVARMTDIIDKRKTTLELTNKGKAVGKQLVKFFKEFGISSDPVLPSDIFPFKLFSSPRNVEILLYLKEVNGEAKNKDIQKAIFSAEYSYTTHPYISPLQKINLVSVAPDPSDNRNKLIFLTKKGNEVIKKVILFFDRLSSSI